MAGERRMRILARLSSGSDTKAGSEQLCQVCADVTAVSGAGIMLMSKDGLEGSLWSTNEVSARVEELQNSLGEGPCLDAYRLDRPVLEPDLADPETARWLGFAPAAVQAGVRAIFGFPVEVGSVRLGALNLYCGRRGPLSDDQHADALVMADVAAHALLVMQAESPPGGLAAEFDAGADRQYVVHQASGMVSAQLDVTVGQALIRLRGYAFGHDKLLTAVAQDVVARRLRFDDQNGQGPPTG